MVRAAGLKMLEQAERVPRVFRTALRRPERSRLLNTNMNSQHKVRCLTTLIICLLLDKLDVNQDVCLDGEGRVFSSFLTTRSPEDDIVP